MKLYRALVTRNCVLTPLVIFTALLSTPVSAVEPQPGQIYTGGTEISAASLGIRFTIPANWKGALSPTGESFLMEPPSATATMFAIADAISADEAFALMQGPVPLTDTVQLVLDGQVKRDSKGMSAKYYVSFNSQLKAEARALSASNGTSISFFLVSFAAEMKTLRPQLDKVFSSLVIDSKKSAKPATNQIETGSGDSDKSWLTYFKGKHIARYFTGSGYTEEQHIWLCSNGQYIRRFNSGGFGGGASGAFQGNYDGSWTATGVGEYGQLILRSPDNQASTYNLRWDYDKNRLFVDGKQWLPDKNSVCN